MHMHEGQINALAQELANLKDDKFIFVSCSTRNEEGTAINNNAHFDILLKMSFNGKVTNIIIDIFGKVYYMP
jgi:hypothetical protein